VSGAVVRIVAIAQITEAETTKAKGKIAPGIMLVVSMTSMVMPIVSMACWPTRGKGAVMLARGRAEIKAQVAAVAAGKKKYE
jgi:hypothetical protein